MEVWPLPPQGRVRKCHAEPPPPPCVQSINISFTDSTNLPGAFVRRLALQAWGLTEAPDLPLAHKELPVWGQRDPHTNQHAREAPDISTGLGGAPGRGGVLPQESQVASWKRRHAEERGCLSLEHESVSSLRWESRGEGEARQQSPPETEMRLGRSWDAGPQNATRRPCLAPSLSDPRS